MSPPTTDRELLNSLLRDVAVLQTELKNLRELVEKVDDECLQFRREVRETWKTDKAGKRTVVVAWIGAGGLLIASTISSLVVLVQGTGQ